MNNNYEYKHYAMFRVFLGTYLLIHFLQLIPYGAEVFSSSGAIPIASYSPFISAFPNILSIADSGTFITAFLIAGVISSILIIIGKLDKTASILSLYILACLLGRNPLINNPSLPFVGWMLLFHIFVPRVSLSKKWSMPKHLFFAAWFILAISYSYSGYTKLLSPSWLSGDTIKFVYENPLARDYFFRNFMLSLPTVILKLLTWAILYIELLFAPLSLIKRARPFLWIGMFIVQLGFLFSLNFPDLTIPMLLIHLLTFDPRWINTKSKHSLNRKTTVYFDGSCGLCHKTVLFIILRDYGSRFIFSPLQTLTEKDESASSTTSASPYETFIVRTYNNQYLTKSNGFCFILKELGGIYYLLGTILDIVPKTIGDKIYDLNAQYRHKYFRKPNSLCPIIPNHISKVFIYK